MVDVPGAGRAVPAVLGHRGCGVLTLLPCLQPRCQSRPCRELCRVLLSAQSAVWFSAVLIGYRPSRTSRVILLACEMGEGGARCGAGARGCWRQPRCWCSRNWEAELGLGLCQLERKYFDRSSRVTAATGKEPEPRLVPEPEPPLVPGCRTAFLCLFVPCCSLLLYFSLPGGSVLSNPDTLTPEGFAAFRSAP